MVRKDAWNDFDFFEFIKAIFMAQDVIYSTPKTTRKGRNGEPQS